jgi:hypothetical protein
LDYKRRAFKLQPCQRNFMYFHGSKWRAEMNLSMRCYDWRRLAPLAHLELVENIVWGSQKNLQTTHYLSEARQPSHRRVAREEKH